MLVTPVSELGNRDVVIFDSTTFHTIKIDAFMQKELLFIFIDKNQQGLENSSPL